MKAKILVALTALLTICAAAPAKAETDVDFGVMIGDRAGIVVVPARWRDTEGSWRSDHRDYDRYYRDRHYRRNWHRRSRSRIYRPDWYGYDRFYDPYRYDRRHHRYYKRGRYDYPRRNSVQIRIGF